VIRIYTYITRKEIYIKNIYIFILKKIRIKRVRCMRNRIRTNLCKKIKRDFIKKLYKIKGISDVRSDIGGVERFDYART
jgi:hypothetical protein